MEFRYNVLFLCTGNSARSIMAEAILNHMGKPVFTAYSAGSHPLGTVRPEALKELTRAGISTEGLRSKSWDEFGRRGAPELHFVFTVCDNAAKETCPLWPGQPMTAHWGLPDPGNAGEDKKLLDRAFRDAFKAYDAKHIAVFGVSRDSAESHAKFATHHALPFPLVADEDGAISRAYGVSQMLGMASRVTFPPLVRTAWQAAAASGTAIATWPYAVPSSYLSTS